MTDQMRAALVTGGASQTGGAIARALHRSGYAVAIQAGENSTRDVEALRDEIVRARGRAVVLTADLYDHAAVTGLIGAAIRAVGPLCLLVHMAARFEPDELGAFAPGELDAVEPERFDRQFAVGLRAPLFLAQAFALQAGAGASIVNVLDPRKLTPAAPLASHALAQSALRAATRMLAQALAPALRVNAVVPGQMPDEVAAAVLYLAGARSVTGVTLRLGDGPHPPDGSMIG
jgi:NAD(P)-dependent dehydrogenase (short-subunit alcohol dehydrogenase family)